MVLQSATLVLNLMGKCCIYVLSDLAYPNLKAGQQNVPRNYFEEANTEKPNGEKCLTNYGRFNTDYRENVSSTVQPSDYKVPCKDANHMSKLLNVTFLVHYDLTH